MFDSATNATKDISGTLDVDQTKISFTNLKNGTIKSDNSDNFALTINGVDLGFSGIPAKYAPNSSGLLGALEAEIAAHSNHLKDLANLAASYHGNDLEISWTKTTDLKNIAVNAGNSSDTFSITEIISAKTAINKIDLAMKNINNQRAGLGSLSNRLDHLITNITNMVANASMSRGRIDDADFAKETTELVKVQILQQASSAMLAQANASKQDILSLLRV